MWPFGPNLTESRLLPGIPFFVIAYTHKKKKNKKCIQGQTPEAVCVSAPCVGQNAILYWLQALMNPVTAVTADCITLISPRYLIRDEMCDRSAR